MRKWPPVPWAWTSWCNVNDPTKSCFVLDWEGNIICFLVTFTERWQAKLHSLLHYLWMGLHMRFFSVTFLWIELYFQFATGQLSCENVLQTLKYQAGINRTIDISWLKIMFYLRVFKIRINNIFEAFIVFIGILIIWIYNQTCISM